MLNWLKRNGVVALGLMALVFVVYWPVLRGQFIWDDYLLVDKNPLVTGRMGLGLIWFQTGFPLSTVAFWAQWRAWGDNAAAYHVTNVLLNALDVVLIWRLLARLRVRGALLGALIFAVHPVCVASVGWISEMKNTLSLMFFLLSFLWYLEFEEREGPAGNGPDTAKGAGRAVFYGLSLAAFLLALLTKTSTVVLPPILLGYAWWRRGGVRRSDWLRTAPFFALSLALGLMTVWTQQRDAIKGATVQTEGFLGRMAGAGWAIWFYLGKALAPVNLSFIYPRWEVDARAPWSYLPLLLLGGLLLLCWRFRGGWGRHVLFGLGCYILALLPVLGLLDMYFLAISRVSDHFQYLPLIAIAALAGAGVDCAAACTPWSRRPSRVATVALVGLLSFASFRRAQVFATEEGVWRDTLARNPSAWPARNNLGCILAAKQQYDDAREQFEASLRLNTNNANALVNLGQLLAVTGHPTQAGIRFDAALKINPRNVDAHKLYATTLINQGRVRDALPHLREALRWEPDVDTRMQYADQLKQTGDARGAVDQLRLVLQAKPDKTNALNNLAWILATSPDAGLRRGSEAVALAERACMLTQNHEPMLLGTLAAAYAEAGRFSDAVSTSEKLQSMALAANNPQLAAVNSQLLALYRSGKPFHEP